MMMFLWLPFLILIPLGIVWLVRSESGAGHSGVAHATHAGVRGSGTNEPIEIARQRLARGEITVEQFEEMRRLLG